MEVKRACQSSYTDHVSIPMRCSHSNYVRVISATYLKGEDSELCLKSSLGYLEDSDHLCRITGLDYIVDKFNKRCRCEEACTRTTFISINQKTACRNTDGAHNIHILYTCENATYFKPPCQTSSTTTVLPTVTPIFDSDFPNNHSKAVYKTTSAQTMLRPDPTVVSSRDFLSSDIPRQTSIPSEPSPTTYSQSKAAEILTSKPPSNSVSAAVIAGATLGALLVAVLFILFLILLIRSNRRKKRGEDSNLSHQMPSIVHVDHDETGGGNGALVVDNINQLSNLPKKYNSLQRKAFILNTVVPTQQAAPRRLPDVVINNDDIVLNPYAVSRNRDFVEGRLCYDNDNNVIIIHHDYARIKGANRDSTLSDESDTSTVVTSSGSGTMLPLSYAGIMPRGQNTEIVQYKSQLPNSPEYATVGPAAKGDNHVMKKVKHYEGDSLTDQDGVFPSTSKQSIHNNESSSASKKSPNSHKKTNIKQDDVHSTTSIIHSKSNNTPSSCISEYSTVSDKIPPDVRLSPQDSILNSEQSFHIPKGTVMEDNPIYVPNRSHSRLSHTSI